MRRVISAVTVVIAALMVLMSVAAHSFTPSDKVSFIVKTADKTTDPTMFLVFDGSSSTAAPALWNLSTAVGDGYFCLNYSSLAEGSYFLLVKNTSAGAYQFQFEVVGNDTDNVYDLSTSMDNTVDNTYNLLTSVENDVDSIYANTTSMQDSDTALAAAVDRNYTFATTTGFDTLTGIYGRITR